ncbi:ATP-binding protein [Kitasatospora sp. NPDC098663]|uniref:ATP-binding protein n=1 Tax=Kitasatospora sp. NPDC098663 TaxID=3364096 RepID=UPI00382A6A2D
MHRVITSFTIPARRVSVGGARNKLLADLAGVPLTPDQRGDVRLAVSEIVGNALEHGVGGENGDQDLLVEATADPARGRLRVTVTNPWLTSTVPATCANADQDLDAESGRGLFIVEAMAEEVGSTILIGEDFPRRAVWFELVVALSAGSRSGSVAEEPDLGPPEGQLSRRRRSVARVTTGRLQRLPLRIAWRGRPEVRATDQRAA